MIFRYVALLVFLASGPVAVQYGIQPWERNPWYWSYKGQPVLLLGASDDDNLFQWPPDQLKEQLDTIQSIGANYVRNTMSDRRDKGFEIYPYKQNSGGKYDLDQWNPEYWERFERFLKWTADRDIIVQIEVWDRFDYSRNNWLPNPYNPRNNINYTEKDSGLEAEYPEHPGRNQQPFFFSTPKQRNNKIVFKYQKAFVEKLISCSLKYGHILYCMDNETNGEEEWGRFWAEFIKEKANEGGVQVFATEMWDAWDLKSEEHQRTFDHPELYDFVDVSQNNHNKGEAHWLNALWVHGYLAESPRPINTVKTYGADNNKFGHSDQDGMERFFRHILAGFASARFHRPPSGLGLSQKARNAVQSVRKLESLVPVWNLSPHMELLKNCEANEAYLAADPGSAYVLYFTNGGEVELEMEPGNYQLRWIEVSTGNWGDSIGIRSKKTAAIKTPTAGQWLAVVFEG